MKNCGVHKGSPARGAGSAQPRLRGRRRFVSAVCLRRPYLFSRKRKDMGEKSAWTQGASCGCNSGKPWFSGVTNTQTHPTDAKVRAACYGTPRLMATAFEWPQQKRLAFKICGAVRIRIGLADCRIPTLFLLSREKSRKTEAVFLAASRRSGGKSKSLRARFLLPAFSFGEVKENADGQLQISNMSSYTVRSIIDYKK